MTFYELIDTAKSKGYIKVKVNNKVIDIDDYAATNDKNKEYTLSDAGLVGYWENDMEWFDGTTFVRLYALS